MEFTELASKTLEDLKEMLLKEKNKLQALRLKVFSGTLKQVHEISKSRKMIAQMMHALSQKLKVTQAK